MKKSTYSKSNKVKILLLLSFFLVNFNVRAQGIGINDKQQSSITNTTTAGDIIVKKWADDKKSAFSFSFDDAFMSHYTNTRPILDQFGFKGTFFLLAGSVHDSEPEWRYGLWWQFAQMGSEGHEMAAHTMEHPHLKGLAVGDENTPGTITYELYQSKTLIEQKVGIPVISFAYPYTEHNATVDDVTKNYFQNARAIGSQPNLSSLSGMQWYSLTSEQPEFDLPRNSLSDDLDELEAYKSYTQNSINDGKWTIFQGHEVVPFSELSDALKEDYYYPITNEWLTDLVQWLKDKSDNNDVWIETIGNVNRYMEERDHFYFNIISSTSNKITIDVGDGLDDNIYNYPLTVDIAVPTNWSEVIFTQGNVNKTLTPFTVNGTNYVRTNINITGSNLTIENSASLYTIVSSAGSNGSITPLGSTVVNLGANQSFTITPNTGFIIESITVDGNQEAVTNPEGQTYTFTNVTVNHSISVTFKVKQYTITASASSHGAINPSGSVLVNNGSDKTFTITPNSGYKIASISVDGNSETVTTPTEQSYTFSNVTSDHSISATFTEDITYYTFSGKILYDNSSNSPLQNVKVKLILTNNTFEVYTDSSGEFLFNNLLPGTYQITFTNTNSWGGVNATDALKTARVFASLDTFNDLQKKAGDVNNDGSINSTDALLIARRFTGLVTTFTIPDWVYDSPTSIIISNQNVTLDINALASGDVDGSLTL